VEIGLHELVFEEPDLIILRVVGTVRMEDAMLLVDAVQAFARGRPRLFFVNDMRRGTGSISGEARQVILERLHHLPLVAVAGIGGGFRDRVLLKLLSTAFKLLSGRAVALEPFESEHAARGWLEGRGCVACLKRERP
jgi:hypothetical protein